MGSSVIGALRVVIGADSAAFEKGLKRADTKLGGFAKAARAAGPIVGAALGAAAVSIGVAVKRTIDQADKIAKVSDKVGVGVEELQRLRHAADLTGVSHNNLDMALQRFSRRIGEAVQGGGELKGTLEQYGIAVTDSEGRTRKTSDVMNDLADAIQGAGSKQEQLRIAFKAFDSEGAALVNTLRNGSAGLEAMKREADELGIVITEDAARAAEKFNDNLTRLNAIGSSFVVTIVNAITPSLANMSDAMVEAAKDTRDFSGEIDELVGKEDAVASFFQTFLDNTRYVQGPLGAILDLLRDANSELTTMQPLPELTFEKMREELDGTQAVLTPTTEKLKELNATMAEGKRVFEETRTPTEALNLELARLDGLLKSGAIDWDTYQRAVAKAKDEFPSLQKNMQDYFDKTGDNVTTTTSLMEGTFSTLQDHLADSFEKGEVSFEGFLDALKRQAAQFLADKTIAALGSFVLGGGSSSGGGGGLLGDFFGGGKSSSGGLTDSLGGIGAAVGSIFGPIGGAVGGALGGIASGIGDIFGFAEGGSFTVGGPRGMDRPHLLGLSGGERVDITPAGSDFRQGGMTVRLEGVRDDYWYSGKQLRKLEAALRESFRDGTILT